ncbi:hypothetical protein CG394_08385, partial [Gardnerella vaginalis]
LDTVNGIDWSVSTLNISVHPDSHYYNPKYETITLDAGTHGTSEVPKSTKNANEATYNQDDIKTGDLPAGTWFEIKKYKSENANIPLLTYALFENGQDNTDDKKNAKDKTQAGKFGKVAFYPHKWMPATTENNPDKVPVVVHYPDGSTSQDEDSGNNGKPIYASVNILRPWKLNGDLHLNVYKQYENGKFTGPVDDINGITVMKGIGLLKNMGIDSWSSHKIGGITLRLLCREGSATSNSSNSQQWSENLDKLFFKLDWQKAWDHASFQEQQECRKSGKAGDGCNPAGKYLLFDSTGNTTERASGTITSSKAPAQTGEYYCAVFALKPDALDTYKAAVGDDHKIDVTNNDIAATINPTGNRDEDWAVKYFPVHVVEQFKLPKTGGEDCVNWNMLLSVVCVIGTGTMAAGFFLDQTKWGRAMLDALLRKTLIKDFICKTAKKLRALRRRSERWRC